MTEQVELCLATLFNLVKVNERRKNSRTAHHSHVVFNHVVMRLHVAKTGRECNAMPMVVSGVGW
jgi:hypothetical protein